MSGFRHGIKVEKSGLRKFDRDFRVAVLDFLDKEHSEDEACLNFHITKRELKRIVGWRKRVQMVPHVKEMVQKEKTLRERLYEKAVVSVGASLDPLEAVLESPAVKDNKDLLPTAVAHLKNRGFIASKVLEGLGDFRKGGDEPAERGPRQPLFTLPPGARVAVSLNITTGDDNAGRSEKTIEITPRVETEVQEGESPR